MAWFVIVQSKKLNKWSRRKFGDLKLNLVNWKVKVPKTLEGKKLVLFRLLAIIILFFTLTYFLTSNDQNEFKTISKIFNGRSISIDPETKHFMLDGKPFRFISGSFHYFRALSQTWERKLRLMKAAGLNTVCTYVEWSLHNPEESVYNFQGSANLVEFIKLAAKLDMYVILRPGPYISAERSMGGFPYWLLSKYPEIQFRTHNPDYYHEVSKWFDVLMPKLQPYFYNNGGPIILIQMENSYGSSKNINEQYKLWLKAGFDKHVRGDAILFTSDTVKRFKQGKIENVPVALNFKSTSHEMIDSYWRTLRSSKPSNPLINMEFYTGEIVHWENMRFSVPIYKIARSLDKMLRDGANINFYMFVGGTNFGFTSGSDSKGPSDYNPSVTSYDNDAPMNEAGDATEKYFAIKEIIQKYIDIPNITVETETRKIKLPDVIMTPLCSIIKEPCRSQLSSYQKQSKNIKSYEKLKQDNGYVLYETTLPQTLRDPMIFWNPRVRDRAYLYVNQSFVSILKRETNIYTTPISTARGRELQIVVENEGRMNNNNLNEKKGLLGQTIFAYRQLMNWKMIGFPFNDYSKFEHFISQLYDNDNTAKLSIKNGPILLHAEFELKQTEIHDTYINCTGWGKGIIFVNGFNLGRYWPLVGPQMTLYVPKELLKTGTNKLTVLEFQLIPTDRVVSFTTKHEFCKY